MLHRSLYAARSGSQRAEAPLTLPSPAREEGSYGRAIGARIVIARRGPSARNFTKRGGRPNAGPVEKPTFDRLRPRRVQAIKRAGRSSDSRALSTRPSRPAVASPKSGRNVGNGHSKWVDVRRSVTAAGPFRIRTGFPVVSAARNISRPTTNARQADKLATLDIVVKECHAPPHYVPVCGML